MKTSKKPAYYFFIGWLIIVILYLGFRKYILKPSFEKDGRYTIGVVYDIASLKGSNTVFYKYKVEGENYKFRNGFSLKSIPKNSIGQEYLVRYLDNHPKISYILLDKPIPKDIDSVPINGWKKLPAWAVDE